MIFRLFQRGPRPAASTLYGAIVAQSRRPGFYRDLRVPDTVAGRFDMIVLHLVLVSRRLARAGGQGQRLAQEVFDLFCRDMDGNLREMGVGDLTVPKRMREFAEAFYGRRTAYDGALADPGGPALADALARNVLGRNGADGDAQALAVYVRTAAHRLDAQDGSGLLDGRVVFPAAEEGMNDASSRSTPGDPVQH